MIERPYRSGKQRQGLIKQQTEEIQGTILNMVENHTYDEIAQWLATKGITATWSQIRYFINHSSTKMRRYTIQPKKTYREKLIAYTDELMKYKGATYTIHVLHMRGSSWTSVTVKLHAAGLIHPMRQYPPIQWRIIGTKDEIREWRDAEIEKLAKPVMRAKH